MYSIWLSITYNYVCYIFSLTCLSPSVHHVKISHYELLHFWSATVTNVILLIALKCDWTHLSIMLTSLCIVGKCLDCYAHCKEWCVYFETAVLVQGLYFMRQLWVGTLYQLVYCIHVAHSGDFSGAWWSWGRKWQTIAVRWNEDPVYYGVRQIYIYFFFFQWDDEYNPDRHNFNASINEYGEVLEGSTCDMCNTKISGGTYKIFTVQET